MPRPKKILVYPIVHSKPADAKDSVRDFLQPPPSFFSYHEINKKKTRFPGRIWLYVFVLSL